MNKHQDRAIPDVPSFTPGPWLSRRWAARQAGEEKARVELAREERREKYLRRFYPERPHREINQGLEAFQRQNRARWLNWTIGYLFGLLFLSHLVGCVSTSHVFEVRPGVYSVSTTGDGFSSASRVREHVLSSATEYCGSKGQRVAMEDENSEHTRMGIDTTINVTFRCVAQ
jgi:hypothetical protein